VKLLRIKAKTTANNTQPSITRTKGRGRNSGKISRARIYGGCADVGGNYANFPNQTRVKWGKETQDRPPAGISSGANRL